VTTRRCKIHYRRLRRDNSQFPAGKTLASALNEALERSIGGAKIRSSVANRLAEVPRQAGYKRVLNNFHFDSSTMFGDLCLFSPGQLQAFLRRSEGEEHTSLDEVLRAWSIAEKAAPAGTEYLHGISYWLAIDDHFYQIQHVAIQSKAMEEYFTWLLRDQAQVIGPNNYVELQSEFDRAQIGDDLGDVKTIEIGGLVPETAARAPDFQVIDVETKETIGDRIAQTFQSARKILVDLLGDVEAQKIIDSVPPEAALEVTVNIGYRATKRRFQKEFMRNLAAGLRNVPDGEIRVRGKDGEIKGDDARLSADMNVRKFSENSSLLDLEDARLQMLEVHRRFLFDGRLTAHP
jgi:hypothetical protein